MITSPHGQSVLIESLDRSRSRSPGESRARLPHEVVKHLEFSLIEPTAESMRGEIPFKNVQISTARPILTNKLHQQARKTASMQVRSFPWIKYYQIWRNFPIWANFFGAFLLFGNFFGHLSKFCILWANFLFSNLAKFWPNQNFVTLKFMKVL